MDLKRDGLRKLQGHLDRRALRIGDERGMIGRPMLDWQEYRANLAPLSSRSESPDSWGGWPVVRLLGGYLQLPSVLDTPGHDRSWRGPAANHGLIVHDGFKDAVLLSEIARHGAGDEAPLGVLTRLRTYSLKAGDADWLNSLQMEKLPTGQKDWVEENGLYLIGTHKEEWGWNREKLRKLDDQGCPIANVLAKNSGLRAKDTPSEMAGGLARKTYI